MEKNEKNKAQATSAEVATVKNEQPNALEIQKDIERKTKELQKCLEDLTRKKSLSDNRTKFIEAIDNLNEAKKNLQEQTDFETNVYRLTFKSGSYNSDEIFKISNRFILLQFVDFITEKINQKIAEIELDLIK